jgi:hypothetical protein
VPPITCPRPRQDEKAARFAIRFLAILPASALRFFARAFAGEGLERAKRQHGRRLTGNQDAANNAWIAAVRSSGV